MTGDWSPKPIPRAESKSTATLLAASEVFLARVLVLRKEPKACALMTASVLETDMSRSRKSLPRMGGGDREGEWGIIDAVVCRRGRVCKLPPLILE